nr:protein PHYLLO, chloroplastic [Ipomoea batatas]
MCGGKAGGGLLLLFAPESSAVFPIIFLSKERDHPTYKSLALGRTHGVFGIGSAINFKGPSSAAAGGLSEKVAEKTQPPKAVVAPSRGFGPWMLVQNKSKQVKQKTSQKQTNKAGEKHAASSNQFAALAENGRTPVHDTNPRGKSKTPTGKGDNSRGKAPAHPTPTPPPARQDPSPSTRQNSQGGRTPHSRGRGNSSAAPRNNGRGGNRGGFTKPSGQSASTERTDPNAGANVFHFGSTSSAANASRGGECRARGISQFVGKNRYIAMYVQLGSSAVHISFHKLLVRFGSQQV